jgi:hypothetical protein
MDFPEVERIVYLILWGVTLAIFTAGVLVGLLF